MSRQVHRFSMSAVGGALLIASVAGAQPVPQWTQPLARITMSPVRFADINSDGVAEVILPTMGPVGTPFSGGSVQVFTAAGSALPGWPVMLSQPITGAALAVGDLDGNGDMELVVQGWFFTYAWNHDGSAVPGWPKSTGTSFSASPALADLDGDGDLEIIVPDGSTMHVWHHTGAEATGWPRTAAESFQAAAVADVDGDGGLEIVAGTWRPQFPDTVPFELHMWNAAGTSAPGFPIGTLGSVRGPVSIGDVDDDGALEIVVRAGDTLHVFNASGAEEPGWPVSVTDPIRNATPSLGDLDGDGDLEILIGGFDLNAYHHDGSLVTGFPVATGATGNINSGVVVASIDATATTPELMVKIANEIVATDAGGTMLPGFPLLLSDDNQSATFSPTPAAGDVDADGDVEWAAASVSGTLVYFDEPEPFGASVAYWPMFQHDLFNTSLLAPGAGGPAGDLNGDGVVDVLDLLLLLAGWGPCDPPCPPACLGDLNGDCTIDVLDLLDLLADWG